MGRKLYLFNKGDWAISAGPESSGESEDSGFSSVSMQSLQVPLLPHQDLDFGIGDLPWLRGHSLRSWAGSSTSGNEGLLKDFQGDSLIVKFYFKFMTGCLYLSLSFLKAMNGV